MIRRLLQFFGILVLGAALAGCSNSLSGVQPLSTEGAGQYRLAAGDELRVVIPGLTTELSNSTFMVNDRGEITLPLAGAIPVSGRTVSQAESELATLLVQRQILVSPTVSIQPVRMRPIYILGEVRNPGEYPYRPNMTVINAVSLAGGYTFRANQKKVAIIRQVNGQAVTNAAAETTPIQPGDTVRVLERWF
ncbi:polysaccharide biosynthesis/export family protein [Sphingomonas arenae]|uniref:polysaccharide biosynthesis/export family protein n=1 Tax=Sphingomonas arenae TaxID=2812555 RepID=UPI00196725D5|nr:polysaccharide biosynthesis/export family protein [Sphingomonas arenae]